MPIRTGLGLTLFAATMALSALKGRLQRLSDLIQGGMPEELAGETSKRAEDIHSISTRVSLVD